MDLEYLLTRKEQALILVFERFTVKLENIERLLEANSFQRTLDRGFALIRDDQDNPVFKSKQLKDEQLIKLYFQDGPSTARVIKEKSQNPKRTKQIKNHQETLF